MLPLDDSHRFKVLAIVNDDFMFIYTGLDGGGPARIECRGTIADCVKAFCREVGIAPPADGDNIYDLAVAVTDEKYDHKWLILPADEGENFLSRKEPR